MSREKERDREKQRDRETIERQRDSGGESRDKRVDRPSFHAVNNLNSEAKNLQFVSLEKKTLKRRIGQFFLVFPPPNKNCS